VGVRGGGRRGGLGCLGCRMFGVLGGGFGGHDG